MFNSSYSTLFQVVTENSYYANPVPTAGGDEADFDWIPTSATVQLMKRYGLLFRITPTGCLVLVEVTKNGVGNMITRIPNGSRLLFVIRLRNTLLPAITDLPTQLDSFQPLFFFTNQTIHNEAGVNRKNIPITKDLSVKIDDQLLLPAQRAMLLTRLGTLAQGPVFGVVDIVLDNALPALQRIVDPQQIITDDRPVFKLIFQHRKSHWRYTIQINTPDVELDDLVVQNLPPFSRHNSSSIQVVFVSNNEIDTLKNYPLPQPAVKLTFRTKVSAGIPLSGTSVARNLPYPAPTSLHTESDPVTHVATIYSDALTTL